MSTPLDPRSLGPLAAAVEKRLAAFEESDLLARLWRRDARLFSEDEEELTLIRQRMGWISAGQDARKRLDELRDFAADVRSEGLRHVLVIGMGGSSLTAEVLRRCLGVGPDGVDVTILDSTCPSAIRSAEKNCPAASVLYVVASKSGTTTEVETLRRHFAERTPDPKRFVAITDEGTPLHELARDKGFRKVFLAQPDIGGRYSALSEFGLVPAALLGIDLERFLDGADSMALACGTEGPGDDNPATMLGACLAEAALIGRNKLTLVLPSRLASFGAWVEQLVAESTGKIGLGVVPIDGEDLGRPELYANDRLFVQVRLQSASDGALSGRVAALAKCGHPVVSVEVADVEDLAGEFFRWEMATAIASTVLGVNPFDQPDVDASKALTREALSRFGESGKLLVGKPILEEQGIQVHADPGLVLDKDLPHLSDCFARQLERVGPGDYISLLAYFERTDRMDYGFEALRIRLRDQFRVPATVGYGPRYLHSTGQLHKGGPNQGVFLLVTQEGDRDISVPGEAYGFSTLLRAQALGDFEALVAAERRVLSLHLSRDNVSGIAALRSALDEALRRLP